MRSGWSDGDKDLVYLQHGMGMCVGKGGGRGGRVMLGSFSFPSVIRFFPIALH